MPRDRFSNRTVLITGAGSGIGRVVARDFADEGAIVFIADIDAAAARAAASSIPSAVAITADVSDRPAVARLVEELWSTTGQLDVLVNNAMTCSEEPFESIREAEWKRDVDVILHGAFNMSQECLPLLRRARGCIVNVSSVNGLGYFGNEAYSAAKAGLMSLTRSIAVRYGPDGVRANTVVPATIATPAWDARLAADPSVLVRAGRRYPLQRVGTPEDVSAAIRFLASSEAAWITGSTLLVDGGLMAGSASMADDIVVADS